MNKEQLQELILSLKESNTETPLDDLLKLISSKEFSKQEVEEKLKLLDQKEKQLDEIVQGYEDMKKRILTPELLTEVDAIESECKTATVDISSEIDDLRDEIKNSVIDLGETVKVAGVKQAVWNKPRSSWDTNSLEKRMKEEEYKWLENYLTKGEPSCTIRKA